MASADVLNPQTFNRCSYCGNSPINITDPTGEIWGVSGTIQWFDDEDAMKAKGFTAYKALVGMVGNQLVALNPNANSYVSVAGAAEAVEQLVKWGAAGEAVVESGAVLGVSSTAVAILALGTLAPADAIDNRPEPVMGYSMSKSQLDYYYKLLENSNSQGSAGSPSNTQGESSPASPNPEDNKPRYEQNPKHGRQQRGNVSPAPTNGQDALDRSVQVRSTSPRRVGVDPLTGEIVVFDRTQGNVYHGHVRSWDGFTRQMKTL